MVVVVVVAHEKISSNVEGGGGGEAGVETRQRHLSGAGGRSGETRAGEDQRLRMIRQLQHPRKKRNTLIAIAAIRVKCDMYSKVTELEKYIQTSQIWTDDRSQNLRFPLPKIIPSALCSTAPPSPCFCSSMALALSS